MARKDVDLVIRAKDEAAKVVDTITKALLEFTSAQADLDGRASKTETSLGKLGAAMAGLEKSVSSLDLGQGLAQDVARAGAAVERLSKQSSTAAAEVGQLSQELARSEAVADRYTAKMNGAAVALDKQKAAVARAKVEQRELTKAYDDSVAAQTKIASRQAALPALIASQTQAVDKVASRYRELGTQMEGVSAPSATLVKSFESAGKALAEKRTKLVALEAEYAQLDGKLRVASAAVTLFGGEAAKAASELTKQEVVLGKIGGNYADLGLKTKAAVANQNALDSSLSKATSSLKNQVSSLERAQGSYESLVVSAKNFNEALSGSTATARSGLESQLISQGVAASKARDEYRQLDVAAQVLKESIGKVGVPTREMAAALAVANQAANEAEMTFLLQQEALSKMGAAYAGVRDDIASITEVQGRFVATQKSLGAALQETAADGFKERQALREVESGAKGAADATRKLTTETKAAAEAARKNAGSTSATAAAYRALLGDTRQSLGLTQRLRGEVLSLVAAYGGFYGVINLLGQVVEAYQVMQAASARLNVANDGNLKKSADDMEFLRRTADRLGVDLGSLANEYSKFAISTQGTNLQGAATRKIFLAVAEAARVNRTSTEEMSGVFVALTQIVSKGAVQMEELRQQLGDRLPGALQIMAEGLGVTTAELIKMTSEGKVSADALLPFADALTKRFGPGLNDALGGTSVALGQLKNAAFQALLVFGNAGFMESFTNLLKDMTDLMKSADFQTFVQNLSAGFASLADAVAFVARNFQAFLVAGSALIALRLSPVIAGLIGDFAKWNRELKKAAVTADLVAAATASTGVAATSAAGGVTLLGRALQIVRANPIGVLLTAAAAAFTYWSTQADEANQVLITHKGLVDKVRQAYDDAGGGVEAWRKKIEGLTVTEAKKNIEDLLKALDQAKKKLYAANANDGESGLAQFLGLDNFVGASQDYNRAVDAILAKWRAGGVSAKELSKQIDDVNQKFDDGSAANRRFGQQLLDAVKPMIDLEEASAEAKKILVALTGTTEDAGAALSELSDSATDSSKAVDAGFRASMDKLKESVKALQELAPKTKQGIDDIAAGAAELELHYQEALKAARALPEAIMRAAAEQTALNEKAAGLKAIWDTNQGVIDKGFGGSLVDRIIGVESGGNASAKNPNSTATGAGQFIESTWLRMFKQYFPDRAAGLTDAMILALRKDADLSRSMVELYLRENAKHLQKAGIAITDANLYLTHFLGPGGAASLIGSAPGTKANDVLSPGQISANKSILDGKTREEVIAWAQRKVGVSSEELSVQERLNAIDQERLDKVKKSAEDALKKVEDQKKETADRLAGGEAEISQQQLILDGKAREAAIQKVITDAKKENPNITQAEIDKLTIQAGKLYDLDLAQKNLLTTKEKAQKAEEEVNNLLTQRGALVDQFEAAQKSGNTELTESLRAKIAEVNAELLGAIENARSMWAAVGGSEGDAAIAKLDAAKVTASNFKIVAEQNYLEWSKVSNLFVTGLSSAFDRFSQAVAEGTSIGEAARDAFLQFASDFLKQIAQMIIQQAIFNALKSTFGGSKFGALIGLGHTGGTVGSQRVGSGNMSRRVDPAIFAGAMRYHTGGIVGLQPNEVPIIAKKGEAMLTENDPFHPKNRGALASATDSGGDTKLKVVNAIDPSSFLEAALNAAVGERAMLNFLRANSDAVSSSRG